MIGSIFATPILATAASNLVLFDQTLFGILVYGALGGSALGLVALVVLILRDHKKGEIW